MDKSYKLRVGSGCLPLYLLLIPPPYMRRVVRGLVQELRILPVLATFASLFLAFFVAGGVPLQYVLFLSCAFFLLYTVHFLDTLEDAFFRKEDAHKTFLFAHGSADTLNKGELLAFAGISSLIFFVLLAMLIPFSHPFVFPLVLLGYFLGILYSPVFSKRLFTSLLVPPLGVLVGMLSAFFFAGGTSWVLILSCAVPVFFLMLGGKAWMDAADKETDAHTGRENIALMWGEKRTRLFSAGCVCLGLVLSLFYSFSLIHLAGLVVLFFIFKKGFSLPAKEGIPIIMPAIFLYLVLEIALQIFPMK